MHFRCSSDSHRRCLPSCFCSTTYVVPVLIEVSRRLSKAALPTIASPAAVSTTTSPGETAGSTCASTTLSAQLLNDHSDVWPRPGFLSSRGCLRQSEVVDADINETGALNGPLSSKEFFGGEKFQTEHLASSSRLLSQSLSIKFCLQNVQSNTFRQHVLWKKSDEIVLCQLLQRKSEKQDTPNLYRVLVEETLLRAETLLCRKRNTAS